MGKTPINNNFPYIQITLLHVVAHVQGHHQAKSYQTRVTM
jgi:hypothetical protein